MIQSHCGFQCFPRRSLVLVVGMPLTSRLPLVAVRQLGIRTIEFPLSEFSEPLAFECDHWQARGSEAALSAGFDHGEGADHGDLNAGPESGGRRRVARVAEGGLGRSRA